MEALRHSLLLIVLSAATVSSASIKWVDCRKHPPLSQNVASWLSHGSTLPTTLHCGQIDVPMDYRYELSSSNSITLGLAMFRPQKPKGVIFFNLGGGDENTFWAWDAALNHSDTFDGLKDFDLMMMDTRGTWSSNPLNVSLPAYEPLLGPYPTTPSEFDAAVNASSAIHASWLSQSRPYGVMAYCGTQEVVQDFDKIRDALGYAKVSMVGASYGSYRAQQYAATFPDRIDRLVLDAVVPHNFSVVDLIPASITATNRALLRADAYCQNNKTCPFRSAGRGSVVKAFEKVLSAAKQAPINATKCAGSDQCTSPVDAWQIQQGLQIGLGGQPDFPKVIEGLALALQGDASLFALAASDPIPSVSNVWANVHTCNDQNFGIDTFENFERAFNSSEANDPAKIARTDASYDLLLCSNWPTQYTVPHNWLPLMNMSVLFVTADFDANAATEWTRSVWKSSSESALVIRHGDNHVSFTVPNQAANNVTKEYLRTGKLPAASNESSFSVIRHPMKLPSIKNPYQVPTGEVAGDVDSG